MIDYNSTKKLRTNIYSVEDMITEYYVVSLELFNNDMTLAQYKGEPDGKGNYIDDKGVIIHGGHCEASSVFDNLVVAEPFNAFTAKTRQWIPKDKDVEPYIIYSKAYKRDGVEYKENTSRVSHVIINMANSSYNYVNKVIVEGSFDGEVFNKIGEVTREDIKNNNVLKLNVNVNDKYLAFKCTFVKKDNAKNSHILINDIVFLDEHIVDLSGMVTQEDILEYAKLEYVDSALNLKANQSDLDTTNFNVELKANKSDVYTKEEVDKSLSLKADEESVQTRLDEKANEQSVQERLDLKADLEYTNAQLDLKANKEDVQTSLELEADLAYVQEQLDLKADLEYTNAQLDLKANKEDVYDKKFVDEAHSTIINKINTDVATTKTELQKSINLKADKTALDKESLRALGVEKGLQDSIDILNGNENVENSIAKKIKVETDRAIKAEDSLQNSINLLNSDSSVLGSVDNKIKVETDRAMTAEENIRLSLQEEVSNRNTAIHLATQDINNEINKLNGNSDIVGSVDQKVKVETDRAIKAEKGLQDAIDLINGEDAIVGSISYKVRAETNRAIKAEQGLQKSIDVLNSDENTEGSVNNKVKKETDRALNSEQELQNEINTLKGDSSIEGSVDNKIKVETDRALKEEQRLQEAINNVELTPGPQGPAGVDGKSAYQLAVDAGFEGSESQWRRSLRGKIGIPGVDGEQIELRKTSSSLEWRYNKYVSPVANFDSKVIEMSLNSDQGIYKISLPNVQPDAKYAQIKTVTVFAADKEGKDLFTMNPSINTAPHGTTFPYFGGFDPTKGKIDITESPEIIGDVLIQGMIDGIMPKLIETNSAAAQVTRINFWLYLLDSGDKVLAETRIDCYIKNGVASKGKANNEGWVELVSLLELKGEQGEIGPQGPAGKDGIFDESKEYPELLTDAKTIIGAINEIFNLLKNPPQA